MIPDHRSTSAKYTVNIKKSFYCLVGIVKEQINADSLSKDIFIFYNNRCNQVILLIREGDGFAIFHKRLEEGTFELPVFLHGQRHAVISHNQLTLML